MLKSYIGAAALLAAAMSLVGCNDQPVQRVAVPTPGDQNAYEPVPQMKPLPPNGMPGPELYAPQGQPGQPGGPVPPPQPGPGSLGPAPSIDNEDAFVQAYVEHRSPRIMVFVNRTFQGDPQPNNNPVDPNNPVPAKYDELGASSVDYDMLEAAMVSYFDNSGKVNVQDSEAARAKLTREQVLRVENGDPAAARLLGQELQTDILIRMSASPTQQTQNGPGVRVVAKAVATTDGRILGSEYVDMRPPMSKSNINGYSRYLSGKLMGDMARKWAGGEEKIEVRVYKTAAVDDALKVRTWLQHTRGVSKVITQSATGGSTTAYADFTVAYSGAPEDLYADLKDAIGSSQGLKATDLQNNTIDLEVTGPLNLVTTTRKTDTTTTVETHSTEEKTIEPINPAPPAQQ